MMTMKVSNLFADEIWISEVDVTRSAVNNGVDISINWACGEDATRQFG